jgi:N-acyl-D-amino-acid deacylase
LARDRKHGPGVRLEFLVKKHTADTAASFGLGDRGLLTPGLRADIAVIDFDRLALTRPEVIYDLPAGGRRLMQRARGYRHDPPPLRPDEEPPLRPDEEG